jgi:hypothetical protein
MPPEPSINHEESAMREYLRTFLAVVAEALTSSFQGCEIADRPGEWERHFYCQCPD